MSLKVEIKEVPEQIVISVRKQCKESQVWPQISHEFINMMVRLTEKGAVSKIDGRPFTLRHGEKKGLQDLEMCIPIKEKVAGAEGNGITIKSVAKSKVAATVVLGGYQNLEDTFPKMEKWVKEKGYKVIAPTCEVYVIGPNESNDPDEYKTELRYLIA